MFLIDAHLPIERASGDQPTAGSGAIPAPIHEADLLRRFLEDVGRVRLSAAQADEVLASTEHIVRSCAGPRMRRELIAAAVRSGLLNGILSSDAERMFEVFWTSSNAAAEYRPSRYEGHVISIAAAGRGWADLNLAWRRFAPLLRAEEIDADHYSIMRPPALASVAALLVETLGEVGERRSA